METNTNKPELNIITHNQKHPHYSNSSLSLPAKPEAAKELSSLGLAGRLIERKTINKNKIRAILSKAWKTTSGVSVNDVEDNLFLFRFNTEDDKQTILDLAPWFVEGFLLVLKPCNSLTPICNIDFTWSPFWVQVHNLPPDRMYQENADTIGNQLGKLLDSELPVKGSLCWNKFLRLKVQIDVNEPLLCGFYLDCHPKPDMWIDFKYEKLQDFCFGCGKLGHARSQCIAPIHHKSHLHHFHLGPRGFGPWIKVGNSGLKALTWLEFLKEEAADSSPPFSDTSNT